MERDHVQMRPSGNNRTSMRDERVQAMDNQDGDPPRPLDVYQRLLLAPNMVFQLVSSGVAMRNAPINPT